jgi:protocatechuate 3,4-dioxygenase beta subunit
MRTPHLPLLSDGDASLAETVAVLIERERLARRQLLGLLGGSAAALAASRAMACTLIPAETAGPFPGNGTNGPNALNLAGVLRSDIRSSFGAAGSAVAGGVLLQVTLRLLSTSGACAPVAGRAVHVWHCDAVGRYSMYSQGAQTQNYLRGVQVSNAIGEVRFTTIFPGAYPGRWPHIHFEIFPSLAVATNGSNRYRVSQLALPDAACREVYGQVSNLYPNSLNNHNATTLQSDGVFGNDSAVFQLASVTGDTPNGYAATLEVGVALEPTDAVFRDGFEI